MARVRYTLSAGVFLILGVKKGTKRGIIGRLGAEKEPGTGVEPQKTREE